LVQGWNLIGYSSNNSIDLSNAKFNNGSNEYTWTQALSNNKIQAYLSYYDSSSETASLRKYKYLSTISGMDASAFADNKGYWIWANQSGNLTLPSAGGATSGQTYAWSKLRFMNSSGSEMNITQAGTAGWVENIIYYYDASFRGFKEIPTDDEVLHSWTGNFIWSYKDNITLIRQN